MVLFKCETCGAEKEGRCRPKKCPACGAQGSMIKEEASSGCCCRAKKK